MFLHVELNYVLDTNLKKNPFNPLLPPLLEERV